jgi:hypothetical protein
MHTRLDTSDLPGRRTVLHIRFKDDTRRFWIVIEAGESSVCLTDPGLQVDVTISSRVRSLYEVWQGVIPVQQAIRAGQLEFDGPRALTRRMPQVLQLSPVADLVRAAT